MHLSKSLNYKFFVVGLALLKFVDYVSEIQRYRKVKLEIVKRCEGAEGFKVPTRRRVVERTLA